MAKEQSRDKAKVRVFFGFAEVEGGDATVLEGVRAISAAVVRAVQNPPPPRFVKALPAAPTLIGGKAEEPTLFDQADPEIYEEPTLDDGFNAFDAAAAIDGVEKSDRKESKPKKSPTYAFVPDLNLHPEGKPSLRDFFAEKKPGDQQEQVSVFLYYLARTLGLGGITPNHLYQCFNDVGKKVPKDILMVARNTQKRKGWVDATDGKNLKITTGGENFVQHDLPPKDAA